MEYHCSRRKVCRMYMEIDIVTFVVEAKCQADRPSRSTGINPSKSQTCCSMSCILISEFNRIRQTQIMIKVCIINGKDMDVPVCEVTSDADYWFFLPVEWRDCMNSASYEYRKKSALRGTIFIPISILMSQKPRICRRHLNHVIFSLLPSRQWGLYDGTCQHLRRVDNAPFLVPSYCQSGLLQPMDLCHFPFWNFLLV